MSDKEFIKIDDLFKGKPEMEEQIPAGAWRGMQDLLEKSAVTGGGAGGRNYGYYAILALFTVGMGASAVGLQRTQLQYANNNQSMTYTDVKSSHANNNANATASADIPLSNNEGTDANAVKQKIADEDSYPNSIASQSTTVPAAHTNNASNTNNNNTVVYQPVHKNKQRATDLNALNNKQERKMAKAERQNANNQLQSNAQIASAIQTKNNTNPIAIASPAAVSSNVELALNKIDKQQFAPKAEKDSMYSAVLIDKANNAKYVVAQESSEWQKEVSTPVNEITRSLNKVKVDEHTTIVKLDTISTKQYIRTQVMPLTEKEKLSLIAIASPKVNLNTASVPVSASTVAANIASAGGYANLVPLENYKVKSSSSEAKKGFTQRFYDMMSDYINKDKPFYFGGILGGQINFSHPLQSGFHLGLGGYYEFKERYTLGVELKYMRNGYAGVLKDEYSTYSDQTVDNSGTSPVFSALQRNFTNNYQLKNTSYIILPITLRYQLSKISVLGGLYGSYMNGTQYTSTMGVQSGEATMVSGNKPFQSTSSSIVANDFKSRFGLGFTLGAGYDFSKHLSLDVRINQNLWNNLKNTSELSTNLYRSTGIQLSLLYFIGKKDKVMYMMAPK